MSQVIVSVYIRLVYMRKREREREVCGVKRQVVS